MDRLVDYIVRQSDIPRPVIRCQVVGNAHWSATSPDSAVDVLVHGVRRRVLYRDGRLPLIGEYLEVQRMNHLATSPWYAQPLATDPPVAPVCDFVEFYFRRNGRLVNPPDQLPQSGLADTILEATVTWTHPCTLWIGLRSYAINPSNDQVIELWGQDDFGPFQPAPNQGRQETLQVNVPGPAQGGYSAYYVQFYTSTIGPEPVYSPGQVPG